MTDEIDRQILRKYDIESKLGKGVSCKCSAFPYLNSATGNHHTEKLIPVGHAGVRYCLEGSRQEDTSNHCP